VRACHVCGCVGGVVCWRAERDEGEEMKYVEMKSILIPSRMEILK
jgi:hypothetical protein